MTNFSIIILFHNNGHFHLIIDALLKQRKNGDEIIIVNDHSDEEHLWKLNPYIGLKNVGIVNSDLKGNRSHNRNIGASHAKNPFLLFVDGDIVLMDNCLHLLRMALESGYVGAFGNIIQGGDTPEQMNLKVGFDYISFLEKTPQIEEFFRFGLAYDRRAGILPENIVRRTEWQFYYSGYCAATRVAFEACGKFNETFQGWGAEDVEFGYRLEKQGDIQFLNGAYAYHISHLRDLYSIMQNNKKNLYLFLSQEPCRLIETFLTFHLSANILEAMDYIKDKVLHMDLHGQHKLDEVGELSVLPVNREAPDGSVAYLDEDKRLKELPIWGMALPFNDNQFMCANLSTDIFCYPESVSAKILQECNRVAHRVKIYKEVQRNRILWNATPIHSLTSRRSSMDRTNYHAHLLNDFTFLDAGEYYTITGGVATKMPYVHIDNLPNVYPNRKMPKKKCILFDLTNGLSDEQINILARDNEVDIYGTYRVRGMVGKKICLSEVVFGEIQLLNIPFIYVIDRESSIDMADIWWNYKNRHDDQILVYQV